MGAAASIAAVFLFVTSSPPREPIGPYQVAEVLGATAAFRDQPSEGKRFNPDSQVEIKVEPKGGRAASLVRVYRIEEGVLVEVPASIEPGVAGVFRIKSSGKEMFGDQAGPKRLVIVAADHDADLSRVAGRTLIAAQSVTTRTSWLQIEADYQID